MKFHDDHDARKWKIEAAMHRGEHVPRWPEIMNTETETLHRELLTALGWHTIQPNPLHRERLAGFIGTDTTAMLGCPPLDANLIQQAREKLLTSENVQMQFLDQLARLVPSPEMKTIYELINATPEQQARAILAAIKP